MDPITAAVGVGIAAGSLGVGFATYKEARRARNRREGMAEAHPYSGRRPSTRLWQKGGNEQIIFGNDGSVAAIGHGPGDFSMGFVQTGKHSKPSKAQAAHTAMFVQNAAMLMAEQRQYEQQQRLQYQQSQRIQAHSSPYGYLEYSPSSYQRPPHGYIEAERYPPRRQLQPQGYIIGEEPPAYDFNDNKSSKSNRSSSYKW